MKTELNIFFFSVRKFAVDTIEPLVRQMDEKSMMDKSVIRGLFENGLMGVEISHEMGGPGCSFFAVAIVVEELARIDPSVAVFCDVQNTLVAPMIDRWGSDEQKKRYLPRLTKDLVSHFAIFYTLP